MEFLSDQQCCRKCLRKGIRVPYDENRAKQRYSFDYRYNPPRPQSRFYWCLACWREVRRKRYLSSRQYKQMKLRSAEWAARALMTKEERQRNPMVHIPWRVMRGKHKGERRIALVYQAVYGRYRAALSAMLEGKPNPMARPNQNRQPPLPPPSKRRHNVLPTA